jgi:hypothetical protein
MKMNWFNKTVKLANPKNQIQKFKVDDPSLKLFIYKYEKSIPWDKITSADDIQAYISDVLLDQLESKISRESPDSHYLKDVDVEAEYRNNQNDPQVQQAWRIYKRDPEGAKKKLLDHVNDNKEQIFNDWWNYLVEENEIYAENPAFIYSIFKPIVDSSPEGKKAAAPPLNQEALASIWTEVNEQGSTQMNVLKRYGKISAELDKIGMEVVESGEGSEWVNIPSRSKDPKNFTQNVDKLRRFSVGTNWCTASGMEDKYLSQGDFWIYRENGISSAAIRLLGDTRISEIRGRGEGQHAEPWWEPIITFLDTRPEIDKRHPHYQNLQQYAIINNRIEEGDELAKQDILNNILNNPDDYRKVSVKNRQLFPEFSEAAAEGYEKRLGPSIEAIDDIKYKRLARNRRTPYGANRAFIAEYNKIPRDIRPLLSEKTNQYMVEAYADMFDSDPTLWGDMPSEVKKIIPIENQVSAWQRYISIDPYRFNDLQIPQEVKQNLPLDVIAGKWKELVRSNLNHFDNVPPEIRPLISDDFITESIINDFKANPFSQNKAGYDTLSRVQDLLSEEEIINIYRGALAKRPDLLQMLPPQYKDKVFAEPQNIDQILIDQKNKIIKTPHNFGTLPMDVQQGLVNSFPEEIAGSFVGIMNRYPNLHAYWNSIPEIVRPIIPQDVRDKVVHYYQMFVIQKPDMISIVPEDLKPYITQTRIGNRKMNWFKQSKKWKDKIPGGHADGKTPDDYEHTQVERGKEVEFEHTDDPDTAREISMDHLEEHPDYYSGLEHMENLLKELEKREENRKKNRKKSNELV